MFASPKTFYYQRDISSKVKEDQNDSVLRESMLFYREKKTIKRFLVCLDQLMPRMDTTKTHRRTSTILNSLAEKKFDIKTRGSDSINLFTSATM